MCVSSLLAGLIPHKHTAQIGSRYNGYSLPPPFDAAVSRTMAIVHAQSARSLFPKITLPSLRVSTNLQTDASQAYENIHIKDGADLSFELSVRFEKMTQQPSHWVTRLHRAGTATHAVPWHQKQIPALDLLASSSGSCRRYPTRRPRTGCNLALGVP